MHVISEWFALVSLHSIGPLSFVTPGLLCSGGSPAICVLLFRWKLLSWKITALFSSAVLKMDRRFDVKEDRICMSQ